MDGWGGRNWRIWKEYGPYEVKGLNMPIPISSSSSSSSRRDEAKVSMSFASSPGRRETDFDFDFDFDDCFRQRRRVLCAPRVDGEQY